MKGAPLSKADISEEGTPFILYGELYTTYKEVARDIQRKTVATVDGCYYSKAGDVIIPTSGETAEDIATATCVMTPDVILAGDLNIFRGDKLDGRFLSYVINHKANRAIARVAQGKSVVHVRADEIGKIKINYPTQKEQKKILTFVELLDNKIGKQQQLIETLKLYKRGLIEAIFADKSKWLCKPMKMLARITTGSSNTQDSDVNGTYPFFIRSQNVSRSNKYIFDGEAILTIGDGQIGKVFHYINGKFDCHQRVYMLTNIHDVNSRYLFHYFSSFFYERAIKMSAKNTVDSVRMEMISDMPVYLPKESTQRNIAVILDKLDSSIECEKSKLSQTELLKRGLLQQLFI